MKNNKLYFAKWLPVEGEINEGDIYFLKGEYKKNMALEITDIKARNQYKEIIQKCKKAKFFLCSNDIEVGDEVIDFMGDYEKFIVKSKKSNYGLNPEEHRGATFSHILYDKPNQIGNIHHKFQCCKVIGEISPFADWVKEGDEFSEEEVKQSGRHYCEDGNNTISYTGEKFFHNYMVKGPCGHFH